MHEWDGDTAVVMRVSLARAEVTGPDVSWAKASVEVNSKGRLVVRARSTAVVLLDTEALEVTKDGRRSWYIVTPEGQYRVTRAAGG